MTAKEYLMQARYLDMRIESKVEQLQSLNDLAAKCTATYSDMPKSTNQGNSRMEDTIIKIIDLEEEINRGIDTLVDLKREIIGVIKAVENKEYQTILEKRYLCFMSWEQIAVDMRYELRYLHKLHSKALAECTIPER